jgi:SAM-dependent methyltransferase
VGWFFLNPQIDQEELIQLYSGIYAGVRDGPPDKEYLLKKDRNAEYKLRWIEKGLGEGSVGRVLDIGCAAGNMLNAFKKRGWEVYGIEPTKHYAEFARKNYKLKVFTGFLEDIEFPKSYFDLITLGEVFRTPSRPNKISIDDQRFTEGRWILI